MCIYLSANMFSLITINDQFESIEANVFTQGRPFVQRSLRAYQSDVSYSVSYLVFIALIMLDRAKDPGDLFKLFCCESNWNTAAFRGTNKKPSFVKFSKSHFIIAFVLVLS